MTFEKTFILDKLSEIKKYQTELKKLLESSDHQILNDFEKLHTAERLLQLIVDMIIDINQHFINELNLDMADDFQGTFYILGEHNLIDKDFAKKMAPVVGLRNKVVHQYEKIDKERFLRDLRKNYEDFDKYAGLILKYLENK